MLSRVTDGGDLSQLGALTGLPPDRVEEIVERLKQAGALREAPAAPEPTSSPTLTPGTDRESLEPQLDEGALEPDDPGPAALYRQELRGMPLDERVQRAREAHDAELEAWCHDANPRVIAAVLENPRTGLTQARLIARHHRDGQGLELLVARSAFAADEVVRRELLRNPQLQAGSIRRLWGQRRLLDQWKWSASRESTEVARRTLRESLRARFAATGLAEERVEVIVKTEGRCLGVLQGIPVDSKTTALLCGRPYTSTMLIQNLARWSAAAPALVAHVLRQPVVRRNPSLRAMLNAHPNAPKELG